MTQRYGDPIPASTPAPAPAPAPAPDTSNAAAPSSLQPIVPPPVTSTAAQTPDGWRTTETTTSFGGSYGLDSLSSSTTYDANGTIRGYSSTIKYSDGTTYTSSTTYPGGGVKVVTYTGPDGVPTTTTYPSTPGCPYPQ